MRGTSQRVLLPESMDTIVAAIGLSASLSLVQIFAGLKLYVPKVDALPEHHPLVNILGLPLAKKLATAVGGQAVIIPQCQRLLIDVRDAEIVRRAKPVIEGGCGESAFALAQAYGLTDRSVRSILARQRTEEGV